MRAPTLVDLFCGAGGLSQGFRQAGFTVLAGVDVDPDACATYSRNFEGAETVTGDLRDPRVLEEVLPLAKRATVIVGGPPCQAFSQVRNHARLIDDPRNSLYREFARVVGATRPTAFVMENVLGMDQMGLVEQVLHDLSFVGEYRVRCLVLDAADFGVPQTRRRMFFIGIRSGKRVDPPAPDGTGATSQLYLTRRHGRRLSYAASGEGAEALDLLSRAADPEDLSVVTVEKAIGDLRVLAVGRRDDAIETCELPQPTSAYQRAMRHGLNGIMQNVSVPRLNRDTQLRLKAIPPGGNHLDLAAPLKERYITGQRWGPESGSGRLERRHYYAYRRLHPSLWSWTLNTKADSVYHYSSCRALSVREFARLQSFPDTFVFASDPRPGPLPGRIAGGPAHSRYRQAGNAVPPRLAQAVADSLSSALSLAVKRATA